jgi:hypothetical protein
MIPAIKACQTFTDFIKNRNFNISKTKGYTTFLLYNFDMA